MKRFLLTLLLVLAAVTLFAQDEDILLNYKLRKVIFKGNRQFSDRQLKRVVDIKPVWTRRAMRRISYRYIKSQTQQLKNYYVSEGFLNCEVRDSLVIHDEKSLHLYFNITENQRFRIKQISIEGNTLLSDGEILDLLDLRIGDPFRQYTYYNNFNRILSHYSRMGHPFANIREEYDWGPELEITLYIDEDKHYSVRNVNIKGNRKVRTSAVRRQINIEQGDPYRLERISRVQDRIYGMGAFNSVNIVPVNTDSSEQLLDLRVDLIESKARRFDFQFGARQGYTGRIGYSSLFLEPQWTHKNVLHRAHRLRVGMTYETLFHNLDIDHGINAEIAYTVPWLIRFRLPTTFKVYYNRDVYSPFSQRNTLSEDDILTDYGVNLSSIWRYNRNIYTRASLALKNVKNELSGEGFEPLTEFTVQSRFDNRNNFIYPSKGWNILLNSGYVLGTQAETETDYFRLEGSVNGYTRILRNMVLAGRVEAGRFFDRKTINPVYLYQMGSETTVRGWFKSIGDPYLTAGGDTIYAGKSKVMGNVELRTDLIWNFGVNVFLDAGRLDNDFSGITEWNGYYVNTGVGIYYKTPIGPVRVELPLIINNPNAGTVREREEGFFQRINFGLLFAF